MELEANSGIPLLSEPYPSLKASNSLEDFIPNYWNHTIKDPFTFEALFCGLCIPSNNQLSPRQANSFLKASKLYKQAFSLEKDPQQRRILTSIWLLTLEGPPPESLKLISEKWLLIGFQNKDPESDFRSGGLLALKNMCVFVEENKELVLEMTQKQDENEFLFAITSINVSFFLKKYFLMAEEADYKLGKEICSKSGFKSFCRGLEAGEEVLGRLHDLILKDLYYNWLLKRKRDRRLNIMGFNEVFFSVKADFQKKMNKLQQKEFDFLEKAYVKRFEKLRKSLL